VLVGDSGFSALTFLDAMGRGGVTAITRPRLDAALYEPASPRRPGTIGRPRTKGARLPTLATVLTAKGTIWQRLTVPGWYKAGERAVEVTSATAVWRHAGLPVVPIRLRRPWPAIPAGPDRCLWHRWVLIRDPEDRFQPQALLCTDPTREPAQIIAWFVRRWSVGAERRSAPFQEARAHLGVETPRQWSDTAIARTTPCLLALFSISTLLANRLSARERRQAAATAWYPKPQPTFSDALAAVRRDIWREQALTTSRRSGHRAKAASSCQRPGPMPSATPLEWPKSS
jgi:hypothetical protein